MNTLQFVNETESVMAESMENGGGVYQNMKRGLDSDSDGGHSQFGRDGPTPGKKTKGRVKIKMEFIENKLRRYTTFSKRKTGIMKKAYELSTLTGTQVMLLVASETGHVYTFATRKLQPMITSDSGKALIQTCLNSPDNPPVDHGRSPDDQRMNPTGFEEPELSCHVSDEEGSPNRGDGKPSIPAYLPSQVPVQTEVPRPLSRPTVPTQPQHAAITPRAAHTPTPDTSQSSPTTSTPHTIAMTTFLPQTHAGVAGTTKPQTISMQLPSGGVLFQPNNIPPGTPIAFSPAQIGQQAGTQASQPVQGANQSVYRLPGFPSPVSTSTLTQLTNAVQTTTAVAPQSVTNPSANMQLTQPVAVLSGTPAAGASNQSPAAGTLMYQTPQGLMYAASPQGIPEGGFIFSMPQNPIMGLKHEQVQAGGATPQYITIPVSSLPAGSTQAMYQQVLAQQTTAVESNNTTATDLSKGRK